MKKDEITIVVDAPAETVREWLTAHMTRDWFHDGFRGRIKGDAVSICYSEAIHGDGYRTFYGKIAERDGKTVISGEIQISRWLFRRWGIPSLFLIVVYLIIFWDSLIWPMFLLLGFYAIGVLIDFRLTRALTRGREQKILDFLTQMEGELQ
ncbi:MAG: hypothetical protein ACI3XD_00870 [Oscillospiraceae bacterium]